MCLPWFHVCASPPPPLSPVSPCTWLLLKVLISHESSLLLLKALDVLLYSFSYNPLTQASTVFLQLLCTTVPTTASRGLQLISKVCHHSRLCPQEGETDTSPPGPPPRQARKWQASSTLFFLSQGMYQQLTSSYQPHLSTREREAWRIGLRWAETPWNFLPFWLWPFLVRHLLVCCNFSTGF